MERPDSSPNAATSAPAHESPVPFREAVGVWARIGLLGFGGPAGQIALMHRLLVEERRWIDEARFLHALNYCMLLPGPEAQQLATYVGWLLHGRRGGIVAGTLFVLPGALAILALSILYAGFRDLDMVEGVFYGIKPAVLAIVCEALVRIARRSLKDARLAALAAAGFVAIFFLDLPFPLIVAGAGAVGWLALGRAQMSGESAPSTAAPRPRHGHVPGVLLLWLPLWLIPVAALVALLGADHVFAQIAVFFSKTAVVTFGGAYAVLAYVAQQAVDHYAWLKPDEMLDGLGMAETTPGPLIMVLQFVGFMAAFRHPGALDPMLAGTLGAALTTWVTFAPCFLWIFLGAPYVEALRGHRRLNGALSAITAAVVGVVLNLALWFALHTVFGRVGEWRWHGLRLLLPEPSSLDPLALGLALAALVAMFGLRIGMLPTLAGAAAVGAVLRLALSAPL